MEYTHNQIDDMKDSKDNVAELLAALCHLEIERKRKFDEMFVKFDPLIDSLGAYFISIIDPPRT